MKMTALTYRRRRRPHLLHCPQAVLCRLLLQQPLLVLPPPWRRSAAASFCLPLAQANLKIYEWKHNIKGLPQVFCSLFYSLCRCRCLRLPSSYNFGICALRSARYIHAKHSHRIYTPFLHIYGTFVHVPLHTLSISQRASTSYVGVAESAILQSSE